jgi:integrase
MSRRSCVPSYRLHKQSGQAVVTLTDGLGGRRDVLLGQHGTPESRAEYVRVLAEWEAAGRTLLRSRPAGRLSVNELILAYYRHAEAYYRHPDGRPTSEVANVRRALRWPKRLYGHRAAADFDSLALEALRGEMIAANLCRNRVNKDVARIKRMFRWGVAKKLVPVEVHQLLSAVEGLRAGRSAAVETEPVRPAAWEAVQAVLPHLRPQVAAMVLLQYHTGMRPGEVQVLRGMDLDTSGRVWRYRPGSDQGRHGAHKTAWRGHDRTVLIGPRGQEVLRPWLRLNLTEYLFQPREAEAARDAERRRGRKTPLTPSQAARRAKAHPQRRPGPRYTPSSYAAAVAAGVEAANRRLLDFGPQRPGDLVPHFSPNQLRHAKATEVRREAGLDAARAVLGHRTPVVTEVYAEVDIERAAAVMERLG